MGKKTKVGQEGIVGISTKSRLKATGHLGPMLGTSGPRYWVPRSYPILAPKNPTLWLFPSTIVCIISTNTTHANEAHTTHISTKYKLEKRLGLI